jgi:hypothetical protein
VWVPGVVLHRSLAYCRQPQQLQSLLQRGFATGDTLRAAPTVAAAVEPTGPMMELPEWQELNTQSRLATLLLLDPQEEVGWGWEGGGWGGWRTQQVATRIDTSWMEQCVAVMWHASMWGQPWHDW